MKMPLRLAVTLIQYLKKKDYITYKILMIKITEARGRSGDYSSIRILEPFVQQRLQLAHVLEGEVESLEPGDGCLGEIISVHSPHSKSYISLQCIGCNIFVFCPKV